VVVGFQSRCLHSSLLCGKRLLAKLFERKLDQLLQLLNLTVNALELLRFPHISYLVSDEVCLFLKSALFKLQFFWVHSRLFLCSDHDFLLDDLFHSFFNFHFVKL
jgi:hypothetical protein